MKKMMEEPKLEIIRISDTDVIATSGNDTEDDDLVYLVPSLDQTKLPTKL